MVSELNSLRNVLDEELYSAMASHIGHIVLGAMSCFNGFKHTYVMKINSSDVEKGEQKVILGENGRVMNIFGNKDAEMYHILGNILQTSVSGVV